MSDLDTLAEAIPAAGPEPDRHELLAQRQRLLADIFGVDAKPRKLGHYELLGELGRGGMGVVYAARDRKLGRKVALKQLQLQHSTKLRQRLFVEARAMAKLAHPNVVAVYEIGEAEGTTFIVMEHVQGRTLRARLEEGEHSIGAVLELFCGAGAGLVAAHAAGLVHRDFKPDNVMVGEDGRARVMDFGLASVSDGAQAQTRPGVDFSELRVAPRLTPRGAVLGTPRYMAPQQLAGFEADAKSDQFAFCVSLHWALYGTYPFTGETIGELRAAIERGDLRPAPRHSRVPSWLRELLVRGLSAEPQERFDSMSALLAAVERERARSTGDGREAPAYVFVVHADADKLAVLQLCQALLDRGLRPWLDMWELGDAAPLEPGRSSERLATALLDAPAVLVCHGARGWGAALHGEALRARVEADRSSVYHVELPGAGGSPPGSPPAPELRSVHESTPRTQLGTDPLAAAAALDELAAQLGADPRREGWLTLERERPDAGSCAGTKLTPYRGLEPFLERDARWMFGREAESAELLARLGEEQPRFVTVIGASGSGKSSLVMAGVCPALRHGAVGGRVWGIAKLRPGPTPCEALAHALIDLPELSDSGLVDGGSRPGSSVDAGLGVERLRRELLTSPNTFKAIVDRFTRSLRSGTTRRLLLVVDQLEELFSEGRLGEADAQAEAQAFVTNLLTAARACPRLRIVATLRADFVPRCLEIVELAQVLKLGAYFALPPLGESQLRAAVVRPARRVGYEVEPELAEKLVSAAAGYAGRLPLLQHLLRQLWQRRDRDGRRLRFATYAETGGLERAIAVAAQGALTSLQERLGPRALLLTRRVMTRLVHLGEGECGHTRRRASAAELGVDTDLRVLLDAFIRDARVLVATEVDDHEVFELAHEALLREWSTLREWLDADREALRLRQELAVDAARWTTRDEREFLWGRARVSEAERVLNASTVELNADERRFLDHSRRHAHQRERFVRMGACVVVGAALLSAGLLATQNHHIGQQRVELERTNFALRDKAEELTGYTGELELKQGELEQKELELAAALGEMRAVLASTRVSGDHEDEVLALILDALSPELTRGREPSPAVRERLMEVLAADATIVRDAQRFRGHREEIYALALSPDDEHFVSASLDHDLRVWSWSQVDAQFVLRGHEDAVTSVAYDPSGTQLVSASLDGRVIIWDLAKGESAHVLEGGQQRVYAVGWSPGGEVVASAGRDGSVQLWNPSTGELAAKMTGHRGPVRDLAFAPNGAELVTGGDDGSLRIWDIASASSRHTLEGHEDKVFRVAYSPDGGQIASAGWDGRVRLWSSSGEPSYSFSAPQGQLYALAYSADGTQVAAAGKDGLVHVWDAHSGAPLQRLEGHRDDIFALAFSPEGTELISGSRDGTTRVWDTVSGRQLATHREQEETVRALAYGRGGTRILAASFDGTLASWPAASERQLAFGAAHDGPLQSLAFSPDGQRVATGGDGGRVMIWTTQDGALQTVVRGPGPKIDELAFSSDGALLFSASEGRVQVWGADGALRRTIEAHDKELHALRAGPGGAVLTAGWDKRAKIWDSSFARAPLVLEGHGDQVYDVAFSPSEDRVASAGFDGRAIVWGALDGERLVDLVGHTHEIYDIAYAPNGQRLATASADESARIWDVESGRELVCCDEHRAAVQHLAWSPTGDWLATGDAAGKVRVFDAQRGELIAELAEHSGGVHALHFAPSGAQLASAGADGQLKLSALPNGSTQSIHAHEGPIYEMLYGPHGELIATVGEDHRAALWRAEGGQLVASLRARAQLKGQTGPGRLASGRELADIACARLPEDKPHLLCVEPSD